MDPIDALEQEWQVLAATLAEPLRQWRRQEAALAPFSSPQQLLRFMQHPETDPGDKDAALAALLRRAKTDRQAGRLVLQALLPGLKQLAGRALFEGGEREVFWELLLAHTWSQIRRYPLERRPRRVAANLLLDSLQRTLRELARERRRRSQTIEPAENAAIAGLDQPELVLLDAVRAHAITALEARLIFLVRLERRALADAAADEELAYNVARVRLQRAERRLLVYLGVRPLPRRRATASSLSARAPGATTTRDA